MKLPSHRRPIVPALAAVLAAAAPALAQTPERSSVYFTGPDNEIVRIQGHATTTVVNDGGTNFRGLAARYDGEGVVTLIVANKTQNGDIRAFRCAPGAPSCVPLARVAAFSQAAGISLDIRGNVWAVNADPGGPDRVLFVERDAASDCVSTRPEAECLNANAGYAAETVVSEVAGASLLADVRVVPGALTTSFGTGALWKPGDLLLLVASPAPRIVRYLPALDGEGNPNGLLDGGSTVVTDFSGYAPTGLAVFPTTGELFVTTSQGPVLRIPATGGGPSEFVNVGPQGVNLSIGYEKDDPAAPYRVFVTATNTGRVLAYRATTAGLLAGSQPVFQVTTNTPYGVANASLGDAVFTPASATPVVVKLPIGHEVTFEKVNYGGLTQGTFYIIEEFQVRQNGNVLQLQFEGGLSLARAVPGYVRGYSRNGSDCQADGAGCYYVVYLAETEAGIFGTTQRHHIDEQDFGFETTCDFPAGGNPNGLANGAQPRLFHSPDDTDDPIVERSDLVGPGYAADFIDITEGCNSHIGRGAQFSLFLTGWDERLLVGPTSPAAPTIADFKLTNLSTVLTADDPASGGYAGLVDSKVRNKLLQFVDRAQAAAARGNTRQAKSNLEAFVDTARGASPSAFQCPLTGACPNVRGELIARGASAYFTVCGALKGTCTLPFP